MFSLEMTAPSITMPHVRGRGVSMTQSKSNSHGRIYIGLFHTSTGLSLLLPPLFSLQCFVFVDGSISFPAHLSFFSPSLFFLTRQQTCPVLLQWSKELHHKWSGSIQLSSTPPAIQQKCQLKRICGP